MPDLPEGVHRLIQIVEELHGKRVSGWFLRLVAFAIAALAVHTIVTYFIWPIITGTVAIWNYVSSMKIDLPKDVGAAISYITIAALVTSTIGFVMYTVRSDREIRKVTIRIKDIHKVLKEVTSALEEAVAAPAPTLARKGSSPETLALIAKIEGIGVNVKAREAEFIEQITELQQENARLIAKEKPN